MLNVALDADVNKPRRLFSSFFHADSVHSLHKYDWVECFTPRLAFFSSFSLSSQIVVVFVAYDMFHVFRIRPIYEIRSKCAPLEPWDRSYTNFYTTSVLGMSPLFEISVNDHPNMIPPVSLVLPLRVNQANARAGMHRESTQGEPNNASELTYISTYFGA